MLTTFKNYFDQKLGNFYTVLFAGILPLMVFTPFGLPILTHFIGLTFLFEIKNTSSFKNLFRANIKTFYLVNIFSFICFLSVLTSISPRLSLKSAISLTYYLNFGFLMYCGAQVTRHKKQIEQGLCLSFILGLFFGFIEAYSEGFIVKNIYNPLIFMHKYNKFTSILCLFLPFTFLMPFEKLKIFSKFSHFFSKKTYISKYFIQIFLCFLSISIIFKFRSDTSKLAVVVDVILICFFLCHFIPFRFKKTFVKFLVCLYFVAPSIGIHIYETPKIQKVVLETIEKGSMYDRLSIWQYVQNLSLSKGPVPKDLSQKIFGYGLHTSKVNILSPQDRTWILPVKASNSIALIPSKSQAIPLHPHNFILQIWLELGYLGLLITFIFLNTFTNYIFRKKSDDLYITVATLSFFNFMTIASIAYSIWQSWWLCAIILSITLSKLFRNRQEINVNDTLENFDFDINHLKSFLQNKRILMTDCSKWIEHNLYRQIISLQPSHLLLLDRSENYLYRCFSAMREKQPAFFWQTLSCDISDLSRVRQIFNQEKPNIIFHILDLENLFLTKKDATEVNHHDVMDINNILETSQQHHIELMIFLLKDKSLSADNITSINENLTKIYSQYFNNNTLEHKMRFMIVQLDDLFDLNISTNHLL